LADIREQTRTAKAYLQETFEAAFIADSSAFEGYPPTDGLERVDQDALDVAIDLLGDLSDPEDGLLFSRLPERFEHRYDPAFLRAFYKVFEAVAMMVRSGQPIIMHSTAEELAFRAIVEEAIGYAQDEPSNSGERLDTFRADIVEDTDVDMLYNPVLDGVETSPQFEHLDLGALRFENWFTPFRRNDPPEDHSL